MDKYKGVWYSENNRNSLHNVYKDEKNGGGSHDISHLVTILQVEYMFLSCFRDAEFASDVKNICK